MTHAVSILRRAQRELEDLPTDAWDLHETAHSLALMTGRLLACKVAR